MSGRRKTDIMSGVTEPVASSKFVANNTVEWTNLDGVRFIRLHDTNILAFFPDGWVRFNSNGWQTPTTKDRMNNFGPKGIRIYQERRVWYVRMGWDSKDVHIYQDGMMYHPDHGFKRTGQKPSKERIQALKDYAQKMVDAMPLDMPSQGDCFACQGILPDSSHSHLESHIEEGYVVPSLMARVLKEQNAGSAWWSVAFKTENPWPGADGMRARMKPWIYKYLYARLIQRRQTA